MLISSGGIELGGSRSPDSLVMLVPNQRPGCTRPLLPPERVRPATLATRCPFSGKAMISCWMNLGLPVKASFQTGWMRTRNHLSSSGCVFIVDLFQFVRGSLRGCIMIFQLGTDLGAPCRVVKDFTNDGNATSGICVNKSLWCTRMEAIDDARVGAKNRSRAVVSLFVSVPAV